MDKITELKPQYRVTDEILSQIKDMSLIFMCPKEELVSQKIRGAEMLKLGFFKVKKGNIITEIDPNKIYQGDLVKVFPFNWENEFIRVYKSQGMIGLLVSINTTVQQFINAGHTIYPQLYNEEGKCEPFEPFLVLNSMEPTWAEKNRIKKEVDE